MCDLTKINQIVAKLNELEDSKYCQPVEKRVEIEDRMAHYMKELYAVVGKVVCIWSVGK